MALTPECWRITLRVCKLIGGVHNRSKEMSSRMDSTNIIIRGAREHNLQNIHLELPRNQLIVFTGVSGSGKSSLAFDTLYAEGQRRYVESLSSYARRFVAVDQHPTKDGRQESALDGRHDYRDPRLSACPVCPRRPGPLPDVRPPHHRPIARADLESHSHVCGGNALPRARAGRARTKRGISGLISGH